MELERILATVDDRVLQCWHIKGMLSFLISVVVFFIGEINSPFIALWSLIVLDMITKWGAIGKKQLDEEVKIYRILKVCLPQKTSILLEEVYWNKLIKLTGKNNVFY